MDELVPLPVDEDEMRELVELVAVADWEPGNGWTVEKALRVLDHLARQFEETRQRADVWRSEIDAWEQAEQGRVTFPATRIVLSLEGYGLAQRKLMGTKQFRYPSGSIETRKGVDKTTVTDEAALLAWCEANCPDAVKHVRTVLVSKLPTHEIGPEGQMIDVNSGEVVPGVRVTSGEHYVSATVKLASQRELPRGPS